MKMKYLYEYRFVLVVLAVILLLTIARSIPGDHFRSGAERNAMPALQGYNLVSKDSPLINAPGALMLTLGTGSYGKLNKDVETINIQPAELTERTLLSKVRKSYGPVIIVSGDMFEASAAWMILAQEGISDLYILEESNERGSFKYQFKTFPEINSPKGE